MAEVLFQPGTETSSVLAANASVGGSSVPARDGDVLTVGGKRFRWGKCCSSPGRRRPHCWRQTLPLAEVLFQPGTETSSLLAANASVGGSAVPAWDGDILTVGGKRFRWEKCCSSPGRRRPHCWRQTLPLAEVLFQPGTETSSLLAANASVGGSAVPARDGDILTVGGKRFRWGKCCSSPGRRRPHCWRQTRPFRGSIVPGRFHWYQSWRIPRHFSPELHESVTFAPAKIKARSPESVMDMSGWSYVDDPLSAAWRSSVPRDREGANLGLRIVFQLFVQTLPLCGTICV